MHLIIFYGKLARYDRANEDTPFAGVPGRFFLEHTIDLAKRVDPTFTYETRVMGTASVFRQFPPNSRVLLLGEGALQMAEVDNNLNKHRGYCLTVRDPVTRHPHMAIATYHPIDCWDFVREESDSEEEDDESEDKDVGGTKRRNYFAWAQHDFRKLFSHKTPYWTLDPLPPVTFDANATPEQIATWIDNLPHGVDVVLDIECRIQDHSLDCVGLRCGNFAFVIPFYRPSNVRALSVSQLGRVYRALYNMFRRTDLTFVGHNLAFDLSVLCQKYGLPLPRLMYDTMIACHRIEPLLEKSLSHAISRFLHTPRNHKADICPNVSAANFARLCQYNSEDLIRTQQLKAAQQRYIEAQGEQVCAGVRRGNHMLFSSLMMSLTGIPTSKAAVIAHCQSLASDAEQIKRVLRVLTGNPEFNPGSPQQLAALIYDVLKYPVLEFTESGARATGAKVLYMLHTKQPNPLFPLLVRYKEYRKAATSMEFNPLPRVKLA